MDAVSFGRETLRNNGSVQQYVSFLVVLYWLSLYYHEKHIYWNIVWMFVKYPLKMYS